MKQTLLLIYFLAQIIFASAGTISGTIQDKKGEKLSFSSILVKGTTLGTTANKNGNYTLQLSPGNYVLICQHVGYTSQEQKITVASVPQTVDFTLEEQQYNLKDVVVKTGGEDPAYAIIRNAIKKREQLLNEVKKFQCEVYIKGQLQLRDFPKKFLGETIDFEDGDTSKKKMLFLSESVARYSVDKPNNSKIEVLSTRVSGNSDGFGLANPQIISFYENNVSLGTGLNPRGFISPISNNALNYYRYKLEGSYFENGREINHIKVTPKRNYEPLFYGYIDIVESEWRIHNVQLMLLKTSQMQFLDTLKISQIYVPAEQTWLIKQQVIYPAGKFLGFDFYGTFVQVYDKFNLNPTYSRKFFDNTIIKVYDSANKKGKEYWDTTRPLPLLDEEAKDYRKKDSLEVVRKDPKYLDSLDRKANKPSISGFLLTGYTYSKRKSKYSISFNSVLDMVNYNTAEGAVVNFSPNFYKWFDDTQRKSFSISPTLRYGFSNEHFNFNLAATYNYGKKYFNSVSIAGGRKVFQFNNAQPITPRSNTFSTLYWRNNFMKIYEAAFASFAFSKGIGNGLTVSARFMYQDRIPLENSTTYSWRRKDEKPFTPNYPVELMNENIVPHQSAVATLGVTWQPGSKYIELPGRKINIGGKYPTFNLSVSQGLKELFGSDADFTRWRVSVTDDLNFKIGGRLNYRLAAGGFLNANKVFVPDYQHYYGNEQKIAATYLNSFQLMPYYKFSNIANFNATAHVEYHLNGLLTNKIPLLKKWNWFFVTGANSLYINKNTYHHEVFFGIENILKVLRVDFIYAFERGSNASGVRFGVPLNLAGSRED